MVLPMQKNIWCLLLNVDLPCKKAGIMIPAPKSSIEMEGGQKVGLPKGSERSWSTMYSQDKIDIALQVYHQCCHSFRPWMSLPLAGLDQAGLERSMSKKGCSRDNFACPACYKATVLTFLSQ